MSDLQCPARFLVVQGGLAEHADLAELLGALREERIAAVYAAADAAAASGAGRLASHLGMPVRPLPGSDRSAGTDGLREALTAERSRTAAAEANAERWREMAEKRRRWWPFG